MTLAHPFQTCSPETFDLLLRGSRIVFWTVLALFAYVRYTSMPRKISPDAILGMLPDKAGAVGFWAGFDYLFMPAYTFFFSICCVWAAGQFLPGSFWYNLGIALAWLQILQLLLDMAENYCMWQLTLGKRGAALERRYRFFAKAKIPLFASAAMYALAVSVLVWTKVI